MAGLAALIKGLFGRRQSRPRGNAPLDPLQSARATASDLAAQFHILRASALLEMNGPMPKFEQLRDAATSPWFAADSPPAAVLFVSHRWESALHPDPQGAQANAIRTLLATVREIDETSRASAADRRQRMPSLLAHGVLQAAYFLSEGIAFGQPGNAAWRDTDTPVDLARVGIWYDFSCMPQEGRVALPLVSELERIHHLIGESTMLSLRWPGDDYDSRAWCAAEISTEPDIERRQCRRIVLRVDELLKAFPIEQLVHSEENAYADQRRETFAKGLIDWIDEPAETFPRIRLLYDYLPEIEEEREMPLFTARRKPEIFRGQRTLLLEMIERLGGASKRDHRLRSNEHLNLDMAGVVLASLKAAQLVCSNPEDLLFTGLMILYARHRGAPQMAAFYGACIARYFARRSLTLARYRERREYTTVDVWYVFDDEPPDSPAWKRPRW
jgi:hypothetical protein